MNFLIPLILSFFSMSTLAASLEKMVFNPHQGLRAEIITTPQMFSRACFKNHSQALSSCDLTIDCKKERTYNIVIKNVLSQPIGPLVTSFEGNNVFTLNPNGCNGLTLNKGQSCQVFVQAQPGSCAVGQSFSGSFIVSANNMTLIEINLFMSPQ